MTQAQTCTPPGSPDKQEKLNICCSGLRKVAYTCPLATTAAMRAAAIKPAITAPTIFNAVADERDDSDGASAVRTGIAPYDAIFEESSVAVSKSLRGDRHGRGCCSRTVVVCTATTIKHF